jgi:hypothetical protein
LVSSVGLAAGGLGTTIALGAIATGGFGRSGATGLGSGGGDTLINDCFGVAGRSVLSDGGRSVLSLLVSLRASLAISLRTAPLPAPVLAALTGTGTTFSEILAVLGDVLVAVALGGATSSIFALGSTLATGLGSGRDTAIACGTDGGVNAVSVVNSNLLDADVDAGLFIDLPLSDTDWRAGGVTNDEARGMGER